MENRVESKEKNLFYTLFANFISLLSGVLATFLIPKFLSVDQYAYLKVFTFYLGYVGVFHLGFNDGVYIHFGKYDYEELPKEKFRGYFRFLFLFQSLMAIVVITLCLISDTSIDRKILFIILAFNIVLTNIIGYFDYISQFTRRFKIYSFNMILSKILYIVGILCFCVINKDSGLYFIIIQTAINILVFSIYFYRYKEIILGESKSLSEIKQDVKILMGTGFFIMIGNFMSIFIIGIDRIFIDKFFTTTDFAMYSFAVSLLSMFYIFVNAITTFVYPYLSRSIEKDKGITYMKMKKIIFVLIGFCLCAYYPFKFIVTIFIPKYMEALNITAIIFPTILLSAEINIVSSNFYKTLKLQRQYTINNIVAGAIAVITATLAFIFFRNPLAIAFSSLLSFYLWGIYSDYFFKKNIGIKTKYHHFYELITIIVFIVLSNKIRWYIAFILYIGYFSLLIAIAFRGELKEIMLTVKEKKRS